MRKRSRRKKQISVHSKLCNVTLLFYSAQQKFNLVIMHIVFFKLKLYCHLVYENVTCIVMIASFQYHLEVTHRQKQSTVKYKLS